jgi:hypothetical protein
MKRAGAKGRSKSASKKRAPKKETTAQVDIAAVRQDATNLIGGEAGDMVQAVIDECKKGHYQGLKFLFEVAGIFPATSEAPAEHEPSFAELLCRHLGLPDEMPEQTDVTNDSPEAEAVAEHTVE